MRLCFTFSVSGFSDWGFWFMVEALLERHVAFYLHIYIYTCVYIYIYIHISYMYRHIYTYTYIYICTYTCTGIYKYTDILVILLSTFFQGVSTRHVGRNRARPCFFRNGVRGGDSLYALFYMIFIRFYKFSKILMRVIQGFWQGLCHLWDFHNHVFHG